MNIAKQIKMNYFDIAANSNKVWIGIAFDNGMFETRFGRVRDEANLQVRIKSFSSVAGALAELDRKHAEKLHKGYRETSVLDSQTETTLTRPADLSKIAVEQISGADDSLTAELIKYLVEVNIHQITHATNIKYDAANATFSTPLGVLTPSAISEARNLLNEIEKINSQSWSSNSRERFISDYYRLVPADFGTRIPSSNSLLNDSQKIKNQLDILDALEASISTSTPTATAERIFKTKLTKIPHYTETGKAKFREIRALYESTRNSHHQTTKLKLTRIYEVEIESMKADFDKMAAKIGNVRADLWHGTKASNLLSILKNGLMIPKASAAHCTGRMFGNGIYTSLQSTKALNYATNFWNGSGRSNQRTFMFLTEVALGKTFEPSSRAVNFPKSGTNSTWVKAGTCGVMNHECIVYDLAQINLKYLCEFGEG